MVFQTCINLLIYTQLYDAISNTASSYPSKLRSRQAKNLAEEHKAGNSQDKIQDLGSLAQYTGPYLYFFSRLLEAQTNSRMRKCTSYPYISESVFYPSLATTLKFWASPKQLASQLPGQSMLYQFKPLSVLKLLIKPTFLSEAWV